DEIFVGTSYSAIFGHYFKNNIIMGSECEGFVHPDDREEYLKKIVAVLDSDANKWSDEYRYLKSDGSYADVNDKAIIIRNNEGLPIRMIGAMQDITNKKRLENELLQSEEQFRGAFDNSAVGMALVNIEGYYTEVNDRFCEMLGYSNQEIKLLTFQEITYYEDLTLDLDYKEKLDTGKISNFTSEKRFIHKNKSIIWAHISVSVTKNSKNGIKYYVVQIVDITSKKRLEDELQQSEKQFKGAFELSAVGMALVSPEGYFEKANDRLCEILGYSKEELKGLTFKDITYSEDLEKDLYLLQKLISGEIPNFSMEKRYIHKNKSLVWIHLSVAIVRNSDGEISNFIPQIIDITERKQFEKENKLLIEENIRNRTIQLNEAKNLYRLLADNMVDLVCLHNLDSTFQYVSPSVKNLIGYEPYELLGKLPEEFIHPEEFQEFQDRLNGFIYNNEDKSQEFRFRNADGKYLWLEITAIIVEEKGIPVSFQTTARDITQRKAAKQSVEKALLKERELNELRTNLVSTISHEFRTPITTIRTSAELIALYMARNSVEKDKQIEKRLNTITSEIDRIIELMNSVLTISKEDSGKTNFNPITFDLKQLCLDVIETSYSHQKDERKVQTIFKGTSFKVLADKNLMQYSLFNLLNNAFKYSKGTGDIVLKLSATSSNVILQIIDKGIGIPQEDQQKLFNTFFRASNTNGIQGTGLGLYIVKTFTEKNSGSILLESQLGTGTKVSLQFALQK
ncbi:PAS domain S-box protein, partial [Flavobacterium sp.]|uniref:PAS domain S-box protein n=1 Tax=Flavobacterium sp. TaxID=239 RepID=UPI00379688B4